MCRNCHAEVHNPGCDVALVDGSFANLSLDDRIVFLKPTGKCPICLVDVFGTKYCSKICSRKAIRKVKWPSKEQLAMEVKAMNWTAIGRKYGVSDNAVRKWAKHYDINPTN